MKTTIKFTESKSFEGSDGFYHKDCPLLFAKNDTITNLEDCPFPLETDNFKVLLFGKTISLHQDEKRDFSKDKFCVVKYKKSCGHTVEERISFLENVEDFDHYGKKFVGNDYSIENWERRINFFQNNLPCDICHHKERSLWFYSMGEGEAGRSRKKHAESLKCILDYNYENWQDFINWDDYLEELKNTKYNSI